MDDPYEDGEREELSSGEEEEDGEWEGRSGGGSSSSSAGEEGDSSGSDVDDGFTMGGGAWDDEEEEHEMAMRAASASVDEPGAPFAAALAQILNTSLKKKHPVLAKNTQSAQVISKERFERRVAVEVEKQKKMMMRRNYIPDENYSTRDFEKQLLKVATKGVVHLFNAVKKHQKDEPQEEKEKRKIAKDDKITKEKFMDLLEKTSKETKPRLSGPGEGTKEARAKKTSTSSGGDQPGWAVLREDFATSKDKLSHWDQEVQEMEEEAAEELEWEDEVEDD
eukprot:TRINITY_DN13165_c0_g1_i1.p1 TRINITY_DN13165_c0_g1~~TRINITY_DN13165_c0_g1_i1.p1  ORF type:complete len:313 (+),score=123.55 TRINITY_DN13165_c0_g1_i1:105-941(+)